MVKYANQILRKPAKLMLFEEMDFSDEFEGVWAAASLIRVCQNNIPDITNRIHKALKYNGIFLLLSNKGKENIAMKEELFNI